MRPIPNLATETTPAAFVFGYMHGHASQDAIVRPRTLYLAHISPISPLYLPYVSGRHRAPLLARGRRRAARPRRPLPAAYLPRPGAG